RYFASILCPLIANQPTPVTMTSEKHHTDNNNIISVHVLASEACSGSSERDPSSAIFSKSTTATRASSSSFLAKELQTHTHTDVCRFVPRRGVGERIPSRISFDERHGHRLRLKVKCQ